MRAIVSVVGKDRKGIIAEVCTMLAEKGVNVLDISQTVMQEFFTMIMLIDTDGSDMSFVNLSDHLNIKGDEMGLKIRIQREDIFNAMHRI